MSLPFRVPRPNMDRFNFLNRNRENTSHQPATQNRSEDHHDDYDDITPLSPHVVPDLEAQRGTPEMAERPAPRASLMPRFRPAIPSWFSVASSRREHNQPRPASSHYSGDGGPPDTVVNDGEIESPKTPLFRIRAQDLPSTRLHLPNLTRTWTQGSNGPPSRPGTARASPIPNPDDVARPTPAVTAAVREVSAEAETGRQRRHHRRNGSDGSHRSHHRSHRSRDETGSGGSRDGSSRSRRTRRRDRERERRQVDEQEHQSHERRRRHRRRAAREQRPPPKRFLFCFPWIKSRRMRTQILRCFVSGTLLAMLLTICTCLASPSLYLEVSE